MFKALGMTLPKTDALMSQHSLMSHRADLMNILQRYFNIEWKFPNYIVQRHKKVFLSAHQIEENCIKLQKYNVYPKPTSSLVQCLANKSHILEHKIQLLQELGVKQLTVTRITRLTSVMKREVPSFRTFCGLSDDENIVENIYNVIGTQEIPELKVDGQLSVADIHRQCMVHYICKYLGQSSDTLHKSLEHMKPCSFRMVKQSLNVLTNVVELNVLQNPGFLLASHDNIVSILNDLKDIQIDGLSILDIVKKYPKIIFYHAINIREVLSVLRSYGISDAAILLHTEIFAKVDKQECTDRLEILRNIPEIWMYKRDPHFVMLILDMDKSLERFKQLKNIQENDQVHLRFIRRSPRLMWKSTLTHNSHRKKQFVRIQPRIIKESVYYIIQAELGEHAAEAVKKITQHPLYKHIRFLPMYMTLKYLKEEFSSEQIARNAQVLLYSCPVLKRALEVTRKEYSAENGYHFSAEQYLTLAQYLLEKTTGFSGDAMWYNEFPSDVHISHLPSNYR